MQKKHIFVMGTEIDLLNRQIVDTVAETAAESRKTEESLVKRN